MINLNNIQQIGTLLDVVGAIVIVVGIIISSGAVVAHIVRHWKGEAIYDGYRKDLARSILLGLEILVAGDIIRTVSGQVSITSVLALAGIVAIRSFLGAEFEMELTGRWPWQQKKSSRRKNSKRKRR